MVYPVFVSQARAEAQPQGRRQRRGPSRQLRRFWRDQPPLDRGREKTLRFRKASETMMAQIYSGTMRTAPFAALVAIAA